ncbi:MAG TPA: hypothetical protein VFQ43_21430 [Nitrososphaera sp.]|nr:hypothetical protein [Nitrososphaera sp.]
MKRAIFAALIALAPTPTLAADSPTDQAKRAALIKEYHRNGGSMVRKNLVDIMSELSMEDIDRFLRKFGAKTRVIERDWK